MNFSYNDLDEIETSQINLLGIDEIPMCPLISIDKDTVKFEHKLQDYDCLEFEIKKYVNDDDGEPIVAQGYNDIHLLSKIILPKLGKFIVTSEPGISYSEGMEKKIVSCKSLEYELSFKDIKGFKINTGETSSYERLYPENIDAFGYTINFIQFYNPDDSRYSLLNIICDHLNGNWKVGYVDKLLQTKKYYFDIENKDIYSFLMQDVSNSFKCIFQFDTINREINAYLGENLGEDTGVIIGYRNLLSSIDITQATDEIYTKFTVVGNNDLDIAQVNFGESQIEDLSYFMNEKFLSKDLIVKYDNWIKIREEKRTDYVNKIKEYISNQESRDEIINRVPMDSLEYDWNTFSEEELDRELNYFENLVTAIENEFKDESGNIDIEALKASIYWLDYQSYTEWIIPNIKIAKENLLLPDDDKKDYLDGWKYDWNLYGTNELKAMMETFDNQMQSAKGYEKAWNELTEDEQKAFVNQTTYDTIHDQYAKAKEYYDSASDQYNKLIKEVDVYQKNMDLSQKEMNIIATSVNINNSDFEFTTRELQILSMLYIESDYSNENFLVTSIMTQVDKIDEELKLLNEARTELSERSRPQYSFSCNLDNLFNLPEFKSWHSEVEVGNFIRVEITEGYQEKLRITSISFNPCKHDNDLSISFANMIISRGERSDLSTLFDVSYSSSKNSISYGNSDSNNSDNNYDDLLNFILNSRKFNDKLVSANLDSIVASDAQIKNAVIDYAKIDEINAVVSNVITETVNLEFVKNLIAGHITAEDIFSTNTTTDFMTIGTDKNGNKIQINANTIQFVKSDGTIYIQLGIDGNDNVSFIMRNKSGDILISPDGITQDAIPDGLIVNSMIKKKDTDYAGISKDTLDIDSIIEGINDNGKISVSSSQVYFDDETQTLNTVLSEMQESVHIVEGKMLYTVSIDSSNGTSISDLQETILSATVYYVGTLNVATETFKYQWYKNGDLVENQTSSTYTIHGSEFTNGAKYICKVSYDNGSVTGSIIISKTGKDIIANTIAPLNPQNGDLWYDSGNKLLKCYDESTSTWISDKSEDLYEDLQTNYYTKTETNNKITSIVGQDTQILDPDGNPVTLKSVYSKSEQTAKGFNWLVSGDGDKTAFAITDEGINSIVSSKSFKDGVDDSVNSSEVITSFKQDFDGFKASVSQTYVDKETYENQILSTESEIRQNAENIELTVKKDNIISSINQSAEEITINANKVNLDGYLTITNGDERYDDKGAAQNIADNIYIKGTTTIDGGIIDTDTLFAQDITATGIITGATLKGADAELDSGKIAGFSIDKEKFLYIDPEVKSADYIGNYQSFCKIDTSNYGAKIHIGAGTYIDKVYYPCFQQGYYTYLNDETVEKISFQTTMFGSYSYWLECDRVSGNLIPLVMGTSSQANSSTGYHDNYRGTLGEKNNRWSEIYARNIYLGIEEYETSETPVGILEAIQINSDAIKSNSYVNYNNEPLYDPSTVSIRSGVVSASSQYSTTYTLPNTVVTKVVVILGTYNTSYADGEHQLSGSAVITLKPSSTTTTTIVQNSSLKLAITAFTGGGIRIDKTGTNSTSSAVNYTFIYLP